MAAPPRRVRDSWHLNRGCRAWPRLPTEGSIVSTSLADFSAQIIEEFRANRGRVGGDWGGWELLLLHRTGAMSRRRFINPLGFVCDGGRYVVCASNGEPLSSPDRYHSLKAYPNAVIEVLDRNDPSARQRGVRRESGIASDALRSRTLRSWASTRSRLAARCR
jgi:F420H(2)-dependent quinone reductase